MAKIKGSTWYRLSLILDPWSYENLLETMQVIHAKSRSMAIRFILRHGLPRSVKERAKFTNSVPVARASRKEVADSKATDASARVGTAATDAEPSRSQPEKAASTSVGTNETISDSIVKKDSRH